MKNYSDLLDISTLVPVNIKLTPIGCPNIKLVVNKKVINYNGLSQSVLYTDFNELLQPIEISIILFDKYYTTEDETAVIIEHLSIDNIDIIPNYTHLADYTNDHNNNNPTNYLGFNGKWTLTIDCPFYHWLHQVQGQGWLLS